MVALQEATDFAKKQARSIIESGEEHQPIIIVFTPEGVSPISLLKIDKDVFKQTLAHFLQRLHAYAYIFIDEAWGVKLTKDSPLLPKILNGKISISELPLDDREEILTIMVAENGKSFNGYSAHIKYTHEGKRYLSEWEEMKGIAEGRLVLREW